MQTQINSLSSDVRTLTLSLIFSHRPKKLNPCQEKKLKLYQELKPRKIHINPFLIIQTSKITNLFHWSLSRIKLIGKSRTQPHLETKLIANFEPRKQTRARPSPWLENPQTTNSQPPLTWFHSMDSLKTQQDKKPKLNTWRILVKPLEIDFFNTCPATCCVVIWVGSFHAMFDMGWVIRERERFERR